MKKLAVIVPLLLLLILACEDNKPTEPVDNNPIRITAPLDGSDVYGVVTVRTSIGADYDINRVIFYVDDDSAYTDITSPFTYEWDTGVYEIGSTHSLSARAYDDTSSYLSNIVYVTIILPAANQFNYQSTFNLGAPAYRVAADGNRLYIALGSIGLKVLDFSNPANLTQFYEFQGGDIRGVDANSPYLVTAERDIGIRLFQISTTPDTIIVKSSLTTPGSAWNVKIVSNIVYVADQDGLLIASISNYNLSTVYRIPITDGLVKDVDVLGSSLYIMDNNGVTLYNVSNIQNPVWQARYSSFIGECQSVSAYGDYVFVGTTAELRMLSDTLTTIASIAQQTGYTGVYGTSDVVFAAQGGSNGGARAYNFSTGTSMTLIDAYTIDDLCNDITHIDNYVFLATQTRIDVLSFVYSPLD